MLEMRPMRGALVWDREHYDTVIRQVLQARTSVWIATANLKHLHVLGRGRGYHSILVEFDRLAREGVELRILHAAMPSRPFRDAFEDYPRLHAGLQLRQCPRVHTKTVIVDGRLLYLGSANFTGAGLGVKGEGRRNFELGWLTDDELVIDDVQARFDGIWRGRVCSGCKLRQTCDAPLDLPVA